MSTATVTKQWLDICASDDILIDCGACALVDNQQVAIFRLSSGDWYAIDNHDPIGGANVLSRGLVAEIDGTPTISSPLFRHHFSLQDGHCLQDQTISVATFPIRIDNGRVQLRAQR
ncbi:nitrite reductase small subunit NirD [Ferrimonas lipolytica]|uniref:Nitrite reductase small subunit NirD n=1 Tax=Ferrimonas lipolytica TaxID=2724191 RepID=A0A6H1UF83_9GAMM|nr:nitrite reductase small subunit NirD [Ferrimonas lipolytica]QIZ77704.1 nitrite reductase small subunit NirD [Ferrimonas lipolytica]